MSQITDVFPPGNHKPATLREHDETTDTHQQENPLLHLQKPL